MFVVTLKFADNKAAAPKHMDAHKEWVQRGKDDGVFLLVGSLMPSAGGVILAQGVTLDELRSRVDEDPFVVEKIVSAEILELTPNWAEPRLGFLVG